MIERPEQRVVPEHPDEDTTMSGRRPESVPSTADRAGRTTSLKPEDRPTPAAGDVGPATGATASAAAPPAHPEAAPLFLTGDAEGFRSRWSEIQTGFVDDPRHAVEQGDGLVAEVMTRLAETFAEQRTALERQWDRGDNVDTENLRVALRSYRSL